MKNLESQLMPLRNKGTSFYTPKDKVKSTSTIKVFPEKSLLTEQRLFPATNSRRINRNQNSNPQSTIELNDIHKKKPIDGTNDEKTLKYLDELYRTKNLQRRPVHKEDYYPSVQPWKLECSRSKRNTDASFCKSRKYSIYQDAFSMSNFAHPVKNRLKNVRTPHHAKIVARTQRADRSKEQKSMTFYKTIGKDEHVINKFKDWRNMDERKSPTYQTSMNRTIQVADIMYTLRERDHKMRKGDWGF